MATPWCNGVRSWTPLLVFFAAFFLTACATPEKDGTRMRLQPNPDHGAAFFSDAGAGYVDIDTRARAQHGPVTSMRVSDAVKVEPTISAFP